VSYDLYFWHHADGHPDDVVDDLESIEPHPSVLAFRADVLERFPDLRDVADPEEGDPDAARYLTLSLPFDWIEPMALQVTEAALRHGLTGWDPQMMEVPKPEHSIPDRPASPRRSRSRNSGLGRLRGLGKGVNALLAELAKPAATPGTWSSEEIRAVFEIGPRRMERVWTMLQLSERVSFAQAVAVSSVTELMADTDLSPEQAREHFGRISTLCPRGVPPMGMAYSVSVSPGLIISLDIYGTARALAEGL
jgi:hypothetical protein